MRLVLNPENRYYNNAQEISLATPGASLKIKLNNNKTMKAAKKSNLEHIQNPRKKREPTHIHKSHSHQPACVDNQLCY